jgi:transcriptional regulator with XRE-family HTH domain
MRIRNLREESGMTLSALAAACRMSKGSMSSIERGLALITIGTLTSIAEGMGLKPADVIMFPEDGPLEALLDELRRLPEQERQRVLKVIEQFASSALKKDQPPDEGKDPPSSEDDPDEPPSTQR